MERIAAAEKALDNCRMEEYAQRARVAALKSALDELQMAPDETERDPVAQ